MSSGTQDQPGRAGGLEPDLGAERIRRGLRIAGGVGAGFVVLFGLVLIFTWVATAAFGLGPGDAPTSGYLVVNLATSALAAAMAGMVAYGVGRALLSPGLLALVLLLLGLVSGGQAAEGQPAWYPLTITVIGAVGIMVGAFLSPRRVPGTAPARASTRPGA